MITVFTFEARSGDEFTICATSQREARARLKEQLEGESVGQLKLAKKEIRPDADDWEEKYSPVYNHIEKNAPWNGTMFETYGPEEIYIKEQVKLQPLHVWTLLDCDGNMYVVPGYHYVNRMGYFLTREPYMETDLVNMEFIAG